MKLTKDKSVNTGREVKIKKFVELHDGPLDTIPKNDIPNWKNLPEYKSP